MISFESDYITGAHPKVLQRLIDTNLEVQSGYGLDEYCAAAAEKIKAACGCPDAQVTSPLDDVDAKMVDTRAGYAALAPLLERSKKYLQEAMRF